MYDEKANPPFFRYYEEGSEHEIWFEDARSIEARLQLLREYNLMGTLYWNLDRPNPQNLTVINSIINLHECNLF